MAMSDAERQMILDLRREINELKRERTRHRTGVVAGTGPVLTVQLGGDCGGGEVTAVASGPVEVGDTVAITEGGGGVIAHPALVGGEAGLDSGTGITITGKVIAVDASVARKNDDAQLTGVGTPTEWNHGANKTYVDALISLTLGNIPEVSSLPASPFDGQTVVFNGWLCRYDASPSFAAWPWTVLGGNLFGSNSDTPTITSTGFAAVPGGSIELTIPAGIKGIFDIEIGGTAKLEVTNSAPSAMVLSHSYSIGSIAAEADWGWMEGRDLVNEPSRWWSSGTRKQRHAITTGGTTIRERAMREIQGGGITAELSRRWIEITPVLIGT